jgi:hypothetical protein
MLWFTDDPGTGGNSRERRMADQENPEIPIFKGAVCEEVEDVYRASGRRALGVAAGVYLRQLRVTPLELLHLPRQQLSFNDAGTMLAQATQKAAGAQVRGTGISVNQRMRTLYAISDEIRGRTRVYHEEHNPAPATRETITDLLAYIEGERLSDRSFRIFSSLALAIDGKNSWGEKFDILFEICEDLAGLETFQFFDALIGEMLRAPEGYVELLGEDGLAGEKITELLGLYRGTSGADQAPPTPARAQILYRLAERDPMPETRHALLDHALHALRANLPLTRSPASGELAFLIELAGRLRENDEFLGGPATEKTIERRELQLISDQTIDLLMADTGSHAGKMLRAFELHEQVSGEKTRRYLEEYVASLMREEQVGEKIAETAGNLETHVASLGQLNRAALRSTMAERTADRFAQQYEKLQAALIDRSGFFDAVAKSSGGVGATALALLGMLSDRAFAKGTMTKAARAYAHALMKQPTFMVSYLEDSPDEAARKSKLRDLEKLIVASGLD